MQTNDSAERKPVCDRTSLFVSARMWRFVARRRRSLLLALAALPLFQTTGCIPDLLGGLSFQLQLLINTMVIEAANTVIQNILHL
jgi:hypothetical protein